MGQEGHPWLIPNDQFFGDQWHLRNIGQTQAFIDADIDADDAWDGSQVFGSAGIRIAIVGDGVETTHADLAANIVQGYDFFDNDSDPRPSFTTDSHETAMAGVAAAAVNNNSIGVAGVAGNCKILPVKLYSGGVFPNVTAFYKAFVYAADNADVIEFSWGVDTQSGTIDAAFSYAYNYGRGGKGCLPLLASGNLACGSGANSYLTEQTVNIYSQLGAGNYAIYFVYQKDASGSANDDCVWLADVIMPDGSRQRLDSLSLPTGWITDGNAPWTVGVDPVHSHGTSRSISFLRMLGLLSGWRCVRCGSLRRRRTSVALVPGEFRWNSRKPDHGRLLPGQSRDGSQRGRFDGF